MPKPLFGDNGSGMHTHISLWKDGEPLFAGSGYAGLSEMAMYAIGGLLKHAPAILALLQPDDQQLQAAGAGLRSAGEPGLLAAQPLGVDPHSDVQPEPEGQAARVPLPRSELQSVPGVLGHADGGDRRDPEQDRSGRTAGQGHLRSAAGRSCAGRRRRPARSKRRSRRCENDHEFLLRGDVFTEDVIDTWIWYKTKNEVDAMRLRPHPYEFCLYYDM